MTIQIKEKCLPLKMQNLTNSDFTKQSFIRNMQTLAEMFVEPSQ